MKFTATAFALLLAVSCASVPTNNAGAGASASGDPNIARNTAQATNYVLLSSPEQIRAVDVTEIVSGFHVLGTLTNRGFIPVGSVQGRGKLCSDGKDMLSFSDLKVYKAADGKTPSGPYLLGCANGNSFQPSSRDIAGL